MKVLQLLSWYAESPSSDDGVIFRKLAVQLQRHNVRSDILFPSFDWRQPLTRLRYAGKGLWQNREEGVAVYRRQGFFPPKISRFLLRKWEEKGLETLRLYGATAGRPDLIHAHAPWAGLLAERFREETGTPFLYTEHSRAPVRKWWRERLRQVYAAADAVTAVSPALRRDMEGLTSVPVAVTPNFYDPAVFYPSGEGPGNEVVFLSFGSPAYTKGYDLLLPAFAELIRSGRDRALLRLGDEIRGAAPLRRAIRRLGIQNRVTFLGGMRQEEVARQMRQADVYVSSSRFETFGMSIVEALACGLPVIVTDTYGPRLFFREEQGRMIPAGDAGRLGEALIWMYDHYREYDPERISAGVRQTYSAEVVIPQYIKWYQEILQRYDR